MSSQNACAYLLKDRTIQTPILCSKLFVRAVRYYTDKDVAVIDIGGTGFFSAHPIPYLNTAQALRNFLIGQKTDVYGVVRKSAFKNLQEMVNPNFQVELLKQIGDEYVVKIQRRNPLPSSKT